MKATHTILITLYSISILGCSSSPKHAASLDDPELKEIAARSQMRWLETADPKAEALNAFEKNHLGLLCFSREELDCPIQGAAVSAEFIKKHKLQTIIFFGADGFGTDSALAADAANHVKIFNRHMIDLISARELNKLEN